MGSFDLKGTILVGKCYQKLQKFICIRYNLRKIPSIIDVYSTCIMVTGQRNTGRRDSEVTFQEEKRFTHKGVKYKPWTMFEARIYLLMAFTKPAPPSKFYCKGQNYGNTNKDMFFTVPQCINDADI